MDTQCINLNVWYFVERLFWYQITFVDIVEKWKALIYSKDETFL